MFPLEKSLIIETIKTRSQNQALVLLRLRHGIFTAPGLGGEIKNKTTHSTTKQIID
jgi:hypothetical protein